MKTYYIYELWSNHPQATKTYIGQTIQPHWRKYQHLKTNQPHSLRKVVSTYKPESFELTIIDCTSSRAEAIALELETIEDRGWENTWNRDFKKEAKRIQQTKTYKDNLSEQKRKTPLSENEIRNNLKRALGKLKRLERQSMHPESNKAYLSQVKMVTHYEKLFNKFIYEKWASLANEVIT